MSSTALGKSVVHTLTDAAERGRLNARDRRDLQEYRLRHLALSCTVTVSPSQLGGIRWMDLDPVEQRYLITAAADSTIEAFDALCADDGGGHQPVELQPLFTVKRGSSAAHRYQVTCVVWYPVDTGMFVTGSADKEVKVWDTNTVQVACSFSCADKVLAVAMSSCASSHALIAVGDKQQGLVLADIASGAFTHTLDGHRSGAWCICWSPCNEHQLFSGDGSGAVRLWDIRRSGCRALLDFNITQRPQPTAPASTPVAQNTTGRKRTRSRDLAGHGLSGEDDGHSSRSKSAGPAVAHEGAVTGLLATQDGLSLLSSGMDHRVRLWDAGYLHHQLVRYSSTFNKGSFPKRMSSTPDGRVVINPRGNDIQVLDVSTGQEVALLSQGHYDTVTACVYSPNTGHLWSSGLDGAVLAWSPYTLPELETQPITTHYMDSWLAAATAGRGRQQLAASGSAAGAAAGVPQAGAGDSGGGRAGRAALPDVDYWSDDEDLLVGAWRSR